MKVREPLDRHDLCIRRKDRVLEIGPGHNPSYRADVVVEKYLNDNRHRCGDCRVFRHQKLVNADGENLPFEDKEFDYVICNQVLEHVDDPAKFLAELTRVGKRGYIETPSILGELLFPKEAHKWVILIVDSKLVLFDKKQMPGNYANNYGELFLNYLPYQSLPYKILKLSEGHLMFARYEWSGDVEFLVNPTDTYYRSFFTEKWNRTMTEKLFPPRPVVRELAKTMRAGWHIVAEQFRNKVFRRPRTITLEEYRRIHNL